MMAASPPPTLLATAVAEALRHSRPRAFEHAAAAAAAAAAALHVMMAAGMVHRASSPPGLDAVSAADSSATPVHCAMPRRRRRSGASIVSPSVGTTTPTDNAGRTSTPPAASMSRRGSRSCDLTDQVLSDSQLSESVGPPVAATGVPQAYAMDACEIAKANEDFVPSAMCYSISSISANTSDFTETSEEFLPGTLCSTAQAVAASPVLISELGQWAEKQVLAQHVTLPTASVADNDKAAISTRSLTTMATETSGIGEMAPPSDAALSTLAGAAVKKTLTRTCGHTDADSTSNLSMAASVEPSAGRTPRDVPAADKISKPHEAPLRLAEASYSHGRVSGVLQVEPWSMPTMPAVQLSDTHPELPMLPVATDHLRWHAWRYESGLTAMVAEARENAELMCEDFVQSHGAWIFWLSDETLHSLCRSIQGHSSNPSGKFE